MNVQIKLNPKNPRDSEVIKHLESMGKNSGEAKRLLLNGLLKTEDKAAVLVADKKPDFEEMNIDSLGG